MNTLDKKILKLCVNGLKDNNLDKKNYQFFNRDYVKFNKDEITFRELLESVREPRGELQEAMRSYYDGTNYTRVFKNRSRISA